MASAACELFAAPLGGTAKTTERTLTGLGSSNWADVRVGQRNCTPLNTLLARLLPLYELSNQLLARENIFAHVQN